MNSKQWVFIDKTIKNYNKTYAGRLPNDQSAAKLMEIYEDIKSHSVNDRASSREINEQIKNLFGYLFAAVHSLELEKKPI